MGEMNNDPEDWKRGSASGTEPLTIRDEICYKIQEMRERMRIFRDKVVPADATELMACIQALASLKGRLTALREVGRMLNK